MTRAHVFLRLGLELGEGPTPLPGTSNEFLAVDIYAGLVHHCSLDGDHRVAISMDTSVGAVAIDSEGQALVACGTRIEGDGGQVIELHCSRGDVRMNDGKADPIGRFVGGTMADPPRPGAGALWSFADGSATEILSNVTISNGLCWSADGATMFYVDTPTQRVDAFDYDVSTGTISGRRTVVTIDDDLGNPDGMTIDHEGGLWVALWGGGAVHRYVDGHLDDVVSVPTSFVTCPAFVGDKLVITTARQPAPEDPDAGHIFVADVGIDGPAPFAVDMSRVFDADRTAAVVE